MLVNDKEIFLKKRKHKKRLYGCKRYKTFPDNKENPRLVECRNKYSKMWENGTVSQTKTG